MKTKHMVITRKCLIDGSVRTQRIEHVALLDFEIQDLIEREKLRCSAMRGTSVHFSVDRACEGVVQFTSDVKLQKNYGQIIGGLRRLISDKSSKTIEAPRLEKSHLFVIYPALNGTDRLCERLDYNPSSEWEVRRIIFQISRFLHLHGVSSGSINFKSVEGSLNAKWVIRVELENNQKPGPDEERRAAISKKVSNF